MGATVGGGLTPPQQTWTARNGVVDGNDDEGGDDVDGDGLAAGAGEKRDDDGGEGLQEAAKAIAGMRMAELKE